MCVRKIAYTQCVVSLAQTNTACLFVSVRAYIHVLTHVRSVSKNRRARSQNQLLLSKTSNIPFYHDKNSHPSASFHGTDFILMQFQCFLISALSPEG